MTNTIEKIYFVVDIQDVTEWYEMNLDEVREFLNNHWGIDDYETEQEMLEHEQKMLNADISELDDMLQGIGYTVFESEQEMHEWREEVGLE
ncbi:hypothetical protein PDQ75_24900 [Bacillus cereus group sp. Bc015]|uniref:hypothetical protein n=1 Tax=Bacillus cereus group sp. Bc015 TaxID=3018123 RepID=UPI0022DF7165|nr:hypothetical protein [Bacillus cereus group sp. Bc015]MDA2738395.1 hypothetical protein [Bacillus cereus group sp. Bc015]